MKPGTLRKRVRTVGYINTDLGKKMAQKGITAIRLASISETSRADISHFICGQWSRVGKKAIGRIRQALNDLGVESYVKNDSVCSYCGARLPTPGDSAQ